MVAYLLTNFSRLRRAGSVTATPWPNPAAKVKLGLLIPLIVSVLASAVAHNFICHPGPKVGLGGSTPRPPPPKEIRLWPRGGRGKEGCSGKVYVCVFFKIHHLSIRTVDVYIYVSKGGYRYDIENGHHSRIHRVESIDRAYYIDSINPTPPLVCVRGSSLFLSFVSIFPYFLFLFLSSARRRTRPVLHQKIKLVESAYACRMCLCRMPEEQGGYFF